MYQPYCECEHLKRHHLVNGCSLCRCSTYEPCSLDALVRVTQS